MKRKKINFKIKKYRKKIKYFNRIDVILMVQDIILYHININNHKEERNYKILMKGNKLIVL